MNRPAPQDTIAPEECATMDEVRAGVDAVDQAILALLTRRRGYMEAAARIKPNREAVRDEDRIVDVLTKVRAGAERLGLEPAFVDAVWPDLIEASIAHEFEVFDAARGAK